jgi:hypothetical protein
MLSTSDSEPLAKLNLIAQGTGFYGVNFSNLDLSGSDLRQANLGDKVIAGNRIPWLNGKWASKLANVTLHGANLSFANLAGTQFEGTYDLRYANLIGAQLNGIKLKDLPPLSDYEGRLQEHPLFRVQVLQGTKMPKELKVVLDVVGIWYEKHTRNSYNIKYIKIAGLGAEPTVRTISNSYIAAEFKEEELKPLYNLQHKGPSRN